MKLQRESLKPLTQGLGKALCLIRVLKTDDKIVGPANDDDISCCMALPPLLCPKVEHIMEENVGEQRRNRGPLWSPCFARRPYSPFNYSGLKPPPDESEHPLISNPMLEKSQHPLVAHSVEVTFNIRIEYPTDLLETDRGG